MIFVAFFSFQNNTFVLPCKHFKKNALFDREFEICVFTLFLCFEAINRMLTPNKYWTIWNFRSKYSLNLYIECVIWFDLYENIRKIYVFFICICKMLIIFFYLSSMLLLLLFYIKYIVYINIWLPQSISIRRFFLFFISLKLNALSLCSYYTFLFHSFFLQNLENVSVVILYLLFFHFHCSKYWLLIDCISLDLKIKYRNHFLYLMAIVNWLSIPIACSDGIQVLCFLCFIFCFRFIWIKARRFN